MSGPTRGPVQRPGDDRDMTEIFQRIGDLERYPPGRWIYVGDYPGDPGTTPDSPPFVGANANAGGGARRLRFRRNSDWSLDIEGVILPDSSGSAPNVVTILNELYRPWEDVEAPGVGGDWLLTSDGELIFTEDGGGCDACAEIAAHIADTEDAHMASAIGYLGSSDLPRDNVQDAIDYLLNLIDTGGGGVVYGTPAIVLGTAAAAGSIAEAIRRDSTIVAFDATVPTTQAFGDAAATGAAAVAARRDHKHAMPANPFSGAAAGGSLGGTYPNPSIATGAVGPTELASTAVAAGTYGDSTHVSQVTVDADGRLTSASAVAITGAITGLVSDVTIPVAVTLGTRFPAVATSGFSAGAAHYGFRVIIPKTGTLHDLSCYIATSNGNVEVAILDTTATTRNILYKSGYIASPGTGWRILADPNMAVTAGDHLDFSIAMSAANWAALFVQGADAGSGALPTGFLPSPLGGKNTIVWSDTTTARPYGAATTVAETSLAAGQFFPLVMARIA